MESNFIILVITVVIVVYGIAFLHSRSLDSSILIPGSNSAVRHIAHRFGEHLDDIEKFWPRRIALAKHNICIVGDHAVIEILTTNLTEAAERGVRLEIITNSDEHAQCFANLVLNDRFMNIDIIFTSIDRFYFMITDDVNTVYVAPQHSGIPYQVFRGKRFSVRRLIRYFHRLKNTSTFSYAYLRIKAYIHLP